MAISVTCDSKAYFHKSKSFVVGPHLHAEWFGFKTGPSLVVAPPSIAVGTSFHEMENGVWEMWNQNDCDIHESMRVTGFAIHRLSFLNIINNILQYILCFLFKVLRNKGCTIFQPRWGPDLFWIYSERHEVLILKHTKTIMWKLFSPTWMSRINRIISSYCHLWDIHTSKPRECWCFSPEPPVVCFPLMMRLGDVVHSHSRCCLGSLRTHLTKWGSHHLCQVSGKERVPRWRSLKLNHSNWSRFHYRQKGHQQNCQVRIGFFEARRIYGLSNL